MSIFIRKIAIFLSFWIKYGQENLHLARTWKSFCVDLRKSLKRYWLSGIRLTDKHNQTYATTPPNDVTGGLSCFSTTCLQFRHRLPITRHCLKDFLLLIATIEKNKGIGHDTELKSQSLLMSSRCLLGSGRST